MSEPRGGGRSAGPTRRQILTELCGGRRTANELGLQFGISASAVRGHLKRLADEGLVRHAVERRRVGKPTHVYELTPDGHNLLSRAYVPVLHAVLESVTARLGEKDLEELLRSAGRSMAVDPGPARHSLEQRVALAAAALEDLGARVEISRGEEGLTLQGTCCPLAPLSPNAPALCRMLESMLSELSGLDIRERCDRGVPPRCRFDVGGSRGRAALPGLRQTRDQPSTR